MALPRPIVFGNWKMNCTLVEARGLVAGLLAGPGSGPGTLGVFPPATALALVAQDLAGSGILVGGQDSHECDAGAFTGSISASQLKDAGAVAVIVGHSERRQSLRESDELIRQKAEAAMAAGLLVVLCVGETEAERDAGRTPERLTAQILRSVPRTSGPANLVVAYEPVWAVGAGRTPEHREIAACHALIRDQLAAHCQNGEAIAVLYGGSVKAGNAGVILAIEGVDGALVGGASLDPAGFLAIYEAGWRN